jgi:hypothetical protein
MQEFFTEAVLHLQEQFKELDHFFVPNDQPTHESSQPPTASRQ